MTNGNERVSYKEMFEKLFDGVMLLKDGEGGRLIGNVPWTENEVVIVSRMLGQQVRKAMDELKAAAGGHDA